MLTAQRQTAAVPSELQQGFIQEPTLLFHHREDLAAALLERGHAVGEDRTLPIVFLGAVNDHVYSKPKIRK